MVRVGETRDRALEVLRAIDDIFNSESRFDARLDASLEYLSTALSCEAMSLCVPQHRCGRNELCVRFVRSGSKLQKAYLTADLGLRERVLKEGAALRIDDVAAEPEFRGTIEQAQHVRPGALIAAPVHRRDEVTGLLVAVREAPAGPFTDNDLALLARVADRLAAAVENDSLMRRLQRDLRERELLLTVSREVSGSLEVSEVLDKVLDAIASVVPFDAASIHLYDPHLDRLSVGAYRGYDDSRPLVRVPDDRSIVRRVLRTGQTVLIDQTREHPEYVEARHATRAELAVPILADAKPIGVLNLESDREEAYKQEDLHIVELIAGQVSSAIINARLHESQLQQVEVDHELNLAREIQLGLLPREPLKHDRVAALGVNRPSRAVSGDYFDYFPAEQSHVWFVVADVSGHGLSAAMLMTSVRTAMRLLAGQTRDPQEIATQLGQVLYEASLPNQFVSAVIAILNTETGCLRYSNAGHVPPLLLGTAREDILFGGGLPLGMFPDQQYEVRTKDLAAGELIAFFTDGVTEAESRAGEQFGVERLSATLREVTEQPLQRQIEAVRDALRGHRRRRDGFDDDVTLMLARWEG